MVQVKKKKWRFTDRLEAPRHYLCATITIQEVTEYGSIGAGGM